LTIAAPLQIRTKSCALLFEHSRTWRTGTTEKIGRQHVRKSMSRPPLTDPALT
jgi:hypothetical protein